MRSGIDEKKNALFAKLDDLAQSNRVYYAVRPQKEANLVEIMGRIPCYAVQQDRLSGTSIRLDN